MEKLKPCQTVDRVSRRMFLSGLGVLGLPACGGGASVSAESTAMASDTTSAKSSTEAAAARVFVHPGLLHTDADFERMRSKVAALAQPWTDGWNALTSNGRSQLGASPRALETVVRGGTDQNFAQMYIDISRAYQLALRWQVSGDTRYADLAVTFLNAWSSTLKTVTGNADRFLAAGIYGYQFANAAEIMRSYSGWAAADFARFQNMMLTVFYPLSSDFLVRHNGAEITNYWANWDQCALACILAVGVLCDRVDIYDEAMAYYKNGQGNGAGLEAVYHVHTGYLGQWQESGRDQGHCTLGIGLAGAFCEMAWNQGDDMYGYENSRFLAGAEYVAKTNLLDANGAYYAMPYLTNKNKQGAQTQLSTAGQGSVRPVWESVYNHYAGRRGIAAPYCALQVAQLHPERDGGNGDQLGFGTLTFSREPLTTSPSGLTAQCSGPQAILSWWGVPGATSYTVKRGTNQGGPYTATIASGITDLLTYTDTNVDGAAAYYYVVTATTAAGETAPSAEAKAIFTPELLARLRFNETSGTTAADASGNGYASTLVNGPLWVVGRTDHAVSLDGVDDYVSLPDGVVADLADFSIATWVYVDAAGTWARIFDFGSGTRRSMFLTPRNGSGVVRYAIATVHAYNEQVIDGSAALPTGQWVHVAVTLSGTVGTLYVNGSVVGTNTAMMLAPFRLGSTTQNWIGRSQYPDPYLKGRVQDFRIYRGALSAAEITALM
ncbi:Alginate lyase [Rhodoferax sp. OV413]|uniref:LamG-like jellyroll fold domain-containing protein n=1 Tax=Rhodoferax sp. OV413 TaxID=1855285 RepID=UPI00088F0A77|nr:LamG-like jellyroll fold domain-containing protein [Rhodoferax sp. OV413]SDP22579.1 Alginate lyase [Rhodoferax sp. OV413]